MRLMVRGGSALLGLLLLLLAARDPGSVTIDAFAQGLVTLTPTRTLMLTLTPTAVATSGFPFLPSTPGTVTLSGPVVTNISPRVGLAVGQTTLSINGVNFVQGMVIGLDGRALDTTFVSPTALLATVPPGFGVGTFDVTVASPGSVSTPLIDAFAIVNLASVYYVPVVLKQLNGSSTGIQVQNLATTSTSAYVIYYNRDGVADPVWIESRPISPGASATFYQGEHPTLPLDFEGSAVVQAAQPIAAVVNRTHYPVLGSNLFVTPTLIGLLPPTRGPGSPLFGVPTPTPVIYDEAPGIFTASSFPAVLASSARRVTAPVVFGGFNGYRTMLSVQNTGESAAEYVMALYATGSSFSVTSVSLRVPPLASRRVRLGPEIGVPTDFVGTAVVTSTVGSMAVVVETSHPTSGLFFSYTGFGAGATTQHAPLVFKNAGGWVSGAQVVNVTTSDVAVSGTLRQRGGAVGYTLPSRTLRPNESYTYYLPSLPEIADGFVGSASFTANGPVVLVVQQVNAERGTVMAYSGFSRGTPSSSLPLLFKEVSGWNTGVQVQNLGDVETTVSIGYFLPGASAIVETAVVAPGYSATFYQRDNPSLPAGYVGSGVVTSSNGQPIAAVVNQVNNLRGGDAAMAYEGINY